MPLAGMTGFGRAEGVQGAWSWAVEARSVNGRNLEVRFRGPPGFDGLERAAREACQARFARGQVNVALAARRAEAARGLQLDEALLARLIALAEPHVASGRVAPPAFDGLLRVRGVLDGGEAEEAPELRAAVEAAMARTVGEAVAGLADARGAEGAALAPVLGGLVDRIVALVADAEAQAAEQGPALKARFAGRLAELLDGKLPEERLVQEAAVLAARADVREELDRLTAHAAAARTLLAADGPVGRKLDFLTQEFMREANTLCSKSASTALTATGLELKTTIEQFREQVQNVE